MDRDPLYHIKCPRCKADMITGYVYGDRYRPVFVTAKVDRLRAYLEGHKVSGSMGLLDFFAARCERCHLVLLKEGLWDG